MLALKPLRGHRLYRLKKVVRDTCNNGLILPRRMSRVARVTPSAIIIGGQKCGTTSLFDYLSQHDSVLPPIRKEIHFFDLNYRAGLEWYLAHFPPREPLPDGEGAAGDAPITIEASPYYIFHPLVARRVRAHFPDIRLIVMMRNPTDRAYSHYWHERKRGYEKLPLEQALAKEEERLAGEEERMERNPSYDSYAHQHFSYISRGMYLQQLQRWFDCFPMDQFLFIQSERFFSDPRAETSRAIRFLGLRDNDRIRYRAVNAGRYRGMDPKMREYLDTLYRPHNRDLADAIGQPLDW